MNNRYLMLMIIGILPDNLVDTRITDVISEIRRKTNNVSLRPGDGLFNKNCKTKKIMIIQKKKIKTLRGKKP